MDIPIHFNDQRELVTIEVHNKALNNLLPPKMDSQFIRPQFLPQDFFGGSHFTAEFFGTLKFFFGDSLTWDALYADGYFWDQFSPLLNGVKSIYRRLCSR